mmetsp:Transcript_12413/g.57464  ORF Transcript_12413/g.57464 Transcript_12413/m.57464 type:complete len:224 (+) Transcript_12413:3468-4139(+)
MSSSSSSPLRFINNMGAGSDCFPASAAVTCSVASSSEGGGCPSGQGSNTTYVFAAASSTIEPPLFAALALTTRSKAPCLSIPPRPPRAPEGLTSAGISPAAPFSAGGKSPTPPSPPPAMKSSRPMLMAACPPRLVSTAARTSAAAARTAALAPSCATAASQPAGSAASSAAASSLTRFSAATSSASAPRLSPTLRWAWNSANDLASISSTRRSSTRIRLRIMP